MSRMPHLLSALAILSMPALAEPAPDPITGKVCILEAGAHLPIIQGLLITKSVARAATPQESAAAWSRYAHGSSPEKYSERYPDNGRT